MGGRPCPFKRKREEDHAILGIHLERCLQKEYRAPLNTTRTIAVKDSLVKNNTEEAGSLNFAKSIFIAFAMSWGCFKQLGAPFAQIPYPCPSVNSVESSSGRKSFRCCLSLFLCSLHMLSGAFACLREILKLSTHSFFRKKCFVVYFL